MYDAIVIGSGNGGLLSALTLQKAGKRVKIFEASHNCGGVATSFVRGRFEFEVSLQELYEYGNSEVHGSLYELFEQLDLNSKISMLPISESFHIFVNDTKEEYLFPFGISNFIEQMERYVPGSSVSLQQFFAICEECNLAIGYLNEMHFQPNEEELQSHFPNFKQLLNSSLKEGLELLNMPLKAQEILSCFWIKLGVSVSKIDFVTYAIRIFSYLTYGGWVPKYRSREISMAILNEFERLGGEIDFLTSVQRVLYENSILVGVECSDGRVYQTHHVVANISPTIFCGKLLPESMGSKEIYNSSLAHQLGAKAFCVYLGLNKSVEELGLSTYQYYIFNTLNHDVVYETMKTMNLTNCVATVLNQVNPNCSDEGTTILTLTAYQFGDIFSKVVNSENYYVMKEKIANQMIESFEQATGLSILEAIEEIEIATPETFARYIGTPDGTVMGYLATGNDDFLSRLSNHENENILSNVRFCGGFGERLHGYASSYLSGATAAMKTLEDMNKEGVSNEN